MVDVASHGRHDRFAIAAALGGDMLPSTVRTCPSCGALHRDLLSIQTAIRHAWTPRRPRDLRLARGDLLAGPPSLWQRVIDAFGSSRDAVTRPLAAGLVSLGIAGVALANISLGVGGGFGAAGASAAATPENRDPVPAPDRSAPVDGEASALAPTGDPLVVVSGVSLAAGGTILGLRHVASRRRGDAMMRNRARTEPVSPST